MNGKKMLSGALGLVVVLTGVAGLSACGDSGSEPSSSATQEAVVDVATDLESARQTVLDALAEDDSWPQVMLASDVTKPTVKYGLLVVPFEHSDAAKRVQSTITIADGEFTIEAVSAATEQTWVIDQDGTITEAAE